MELTQGSTYNIHFSISDDAGNAVTPNEIETLEFQIGNIRKMFSNESDDISFSEGKFHVKLSQKETFSFSDKVDYQIRIKFLDERGVKASDKFRCGIRRSISKEIL